MKEGIVLRHDIIAYAFLADAVTAEQSVYRGTTSLCQEGVSKFPI